ncbi:LamG domain-containing protein [Paenibacillus sp. HB172176]|uniref:LamG domain-containing protein n=1 Tax=Paenibacillus sp. HB172176 TaxID=2493690 RepID=UPI00143BA8FE|nr:LamG domain-containing protein [Paenibacillus sp. HB172176]
MPEQQKTAVILNQPSLLAFWDFQEQAGTDSIAKGAHACKLTEQAGPIARVEDGLFGKYAAKVKQGQWWRLPRAECPELDFHGKDARLTIIAWIKRENIENHGCQAIAGMWNETERKRQYCLFLNLRIWESEDQVCGHVSSVGGPTPGRKYCMTSAIGATPVSKEEWHAVAFTYDGEYARVYLDGQLDKRDGFNPYLYDQGLYDGGSDGAEFTVGAVSHSGSMGNFYTGLLGGLAVFNTALTEEEIARMTFLAD